MKYKLRDPKTEPAYEWHSWFAWFPVIAKESGHYTVNNYSDSHYVIWWRHVLRRKRSDSNLVWWQYEVR